MSNNPQQNKSATLVVESPEITALKAQLAEMQVQKAKLEADAKALKDQLAVAGPSISLKVGEKGGVSLYGMGRFPVTLYAEQWTQLLTVHAKTVLAFIDSKPAGLKTKADKIAEKAAKDEAERKARIAAAGMTGRTA